MDSRWSEFFVILPLRIGVYSPLRWICAVPVTTYHKNEERVILYQLQAYPLRVKGMFASSLFFLAFFLLKPSCYSMRSLSHREWPCVATVDQLSSWPTASINCQPCEWTSFGIPLRWSSQMTIIPDTITQNRKPLSWAQAVQIVIKGNKWFLFSANKFWVGLLFRNR